MHLASGVIGLVRRYPYGGIRKLLECAVFYTTSGGSDLVLSFRNSRIGAKVST